MNSQWLNVLFKTYPEKTKKSLADFLGMEPPAVSKMLNGTRQIKAEEYVAMRTFFGMGNDGDHAVTTRGSLDVISKDSGRQFLTEGRLPSGQWDSAQNIAQEHSNIVYKATMVIENPDDYMEPDFKVGEKILVNLDDRTPDLKGVFVVSEGINYMVRECETVTNKGVSQFKISAKKDDFVPQILEMNDLYIIGRVIGKVEI